METKNSYNSIKRHGTGEKIHLMNLQHYNYLKTVEYHFISTLKR